MIFVLGSGHSEHSNVPELENPTSQLPQTAPVYPVKQKPYGL